ncbi:DUF3035 domain-containing protein [Rickettsiales endosymbiont of Stachyamoeba lipophora]|uniref:DUF3035 domain-containing protein n=1 Tax=Rickettsiales endosymbiont of Stachyamoeba lipophora TaxID=2486578 RepID=UPI000F64FCF3|nr:DUF3035 domain-containing protein [Rickettsiales endosymbiont of Stachyamoeba lipophora]AZL16019.1 DUF3035 domain-containing protein [Rickettsiales endosymbiont of Stachyamoeba lipophora]
MRIISLVLLLVVLTACNQSMKRNLGLIRSAPDEFMVISQPDLILPPNYDLVKPGTPVDVYSVLNGSKDVNIPIEFNQAEELMLKRLGLNSRDPAIRQSLSADKKPEDYTEEKSLIDKAGMILKRDDENQVKHIIIPAEEKNRIEENRKNNRSLLEGEIKSEKQEKTLIDKVLGK